MVPSSAGRRPSHPGNPADRMVCEKPASWTEELFRDMGRIDCRGALAIYRGEVPEHVVNPQVLSSPAFLKKLSNYKTADHAADKTS